MATKANPQTPGTKYRDTDGVIRTYGPPKAATPVASNSNEAAAQSRLEDFNKSPGAQDLYNQQVEREQGSLNELIARMRSQPTATSLYDQYSNQAGVQDIRSRITPLEQSLAELENTMDGLGMRVTNQVKGTMTTQAQRDAILAREQSKLSGTIGAQARLLGVQQGALQGAQNEVTNRLGLTLQDQGKELEPYKLQFSVLADRAAREMSAFSSDREQELGIILDSIKRGRELDDNALDRFNQIADQKTLYDQQKQTALDSLYAQYGLDSKGNKTPLYGAKIAEEDRTRQNQLTDLASELKLRKSFQSPGGGDSAADKKYQKLLELGVAQDKALEAAYGVSNTQADPLDSYIDEQINRATGKSSGASGNIMSLLTSLLGG